ncbi:hypothetical protein M0P48_02445 [Candidatus Gracilibacteria bacterium]|nr:hypothetical protein [Candidatus Gracilibacteria bacterium]
MIKECKKCSEKFDISAEDSNFYKKIEVLPPTLCPDCRQQRRLSFRNERNLYKRKCDLTGKEIISIYSPDKKLKVYSQEIWWSDKWNALDYGIEFDFSKPFFQQFAQLMKEVPRLAIINRNSENSIYTNICEQNKNCYMLIESSNNEDCLYSYWIQKSKDCMDMSFCTECENSYECFYCGKSYGLLFSVNCDNCSDSYFLKNCTGCRNCFGCINMSQKQYHIFNKQYSKNDYEEKIKTLKQDLLKDIEATKKHFKNFCLKFPNKYAEIIRSQNCSGNYISNSKDCENCFHASDAENCKNSVHIWRNAKFVYDCDTVGMDSELAYECINTAINSYNNKFCNRCWSVSESFYSNECDNSNNLFGCIGLNHKKYCILNKEYKKEEYEKLLKKIRTHMKKTGEWGEFFPENLSPFEYSETVANDYFPQESEKNKNQNSSNPDIPTCEECRKNYKITDYEKNFYERLFLPTPKNCPDCRHKTRMLWENSRKLLERTCAKCKIKVKTTYPKTSKEIVYCEKCYLEAK